MRRLCSVIIFLVLSQYVICSLISERVTKDIPMQEAEVEENSVVVPVENTAQVQSAAAGNDKCAKVGEFCINHKDCCSNSCLGFMRRCVSGREFLEDS